MSLMVHRRTCDLHEGDILLDGASIVRVEGVDIDEMDDGHCWLSGICISGNYDQWDIPRCVTYDDVWAVLI